MAQKKAKPATKGKTGSEKSMDVKNKVNATGAVKPSISAMPAKAKGSISPVAAKGSAPITKKPAGSVKPSVVAVPSKMAPAASVKSAPSKVAMTNPPVKKIDGGKASSAKAVAKAAEPRPVAAPVKVAPSKVAVGTAVKPAPIATGPAASASPKAIAGSAAVLAAKTAAPPVAVPAPVASNDPKKPVSARHGFKTNEWIVYPAQGVGRIVAIEEQEIAGMKLELFVITFEKDKMTLRVPTGKAQTVGMRKLAEDGVVRRAMETLKGRARIKRTMWSRRAQEFEAKINSGDLVAVAEVVRDLYRAESQPEQSYSERLLFERALDRMAREIAAVDKLDERGASQKIVDVLSKSAKARKPAGEDAAPSASDDETTAAA